jgi:hypothetical protein
MNTKPLERVSVIPEDRLLDLPVLAQAITPMEMLNRAVAAGADIDVLEKLMSLQERWEANQARKAFDEAVAAAKAEIKPIVRNSTGHNSKKYADFSAIAGAVDPILSKNGLSYRFRAAQTDKVTVTCVLSHKSGHSEETPLSSQPDKTGNKNDIQAIGSALTYLQRYSLMLALGLAAAHDDDGKSAPTTGAATISPDQLGDLVSLIQDVGGARHEELKAGLLKYFGFERLADIPATEFKRAVAAINKKRQRA